MTSCGINEKQQNKSSALVPPVYFFTVAYHPEVRGISDCIM